MCVCVVFCGYVFVVVVCNHGSIYWRCLFSSVSGWLYFYILFVSCSCCCCGLVLMLLLHFSVGFYSSSSSLHV